MGSPFGGKMAGPDILTIMCATRIRDYSLLADDQTLGFDWSRVIGQVGAAGVSTGLGLLFGPHQQHPHPLTDSGEMSAALDNMWLQTWQPAKAQLPPDQLLQLALQIRAWLHDPQAFGQSGTENDAYLNNSKASIDSEIAALQPALAATPARTQVVTDPATGQTVTVPAAVGTQIDTTTLLLLAGAGVLLIVVLGR